MSSHFNKQRRNALALLSTNGLSTLFAALPDTARATPVKPGLLRIGYQKYGSLTILKGTGTLEKKLTPLGVEVRWVEFPAGPQLLEGLNVGSIDIGYTGEAPPIFAQAAGADLVYFGNEPPGPASEAIVVPANSPLRSAAELRGKKIVLNKGSNVHYLLVKVLEKYRIAYSDVQVIFLAPADARAAFERGSVDAWAIWDPFLAAAQVQLKARLLVDGTGLVSNHQFYLAAKSYAQTNAPVVQILIDELSAVSRWASANLPAVATILSQQTGLGPDVINLSAQRYSFGINPLTEAVTREQQGVADAFYQLKLIPKKIDIASVVTHINA